MPLDPLDEFLPPRYRSAGRRPEANNDRTAAANAPLSALRGWAAGTAGLPGDIEGLARAGISQLPPQVLAAFPALRAFGIGSRADPTPQLPTTEFYNEYLPGAQLNQTPTGKAFTTAGNLFGGAGSTTLARYGIKSAKATAKAIAEAAPGPASGSRAAQLGVIKMPGGNFLKGSVEESVSPMKRRGTPSLATSQEEADDLIARGFVRDKSGGDGVYLPPDPVNTFIDKKIAPYIRNEMATPGDPLRAMAEKYAVDKPVKLAEVQGRIDAFAAKMEQEARERGVPVEMLTSMRQQMIGLEKEKALVEAREGLHSELFPPNVDDIENLGNVRYDQGFEPGGMGQSEQARIWEDLADVAFDEPSQAGSRWGEATLQTDPWLRKVPPETPVYGEFLSTDNLGFRHLVDELRNATNPASGLPANLHIDPADLGKLTLPQAVDRVADINAWRATQKIEANQLLANNAATFLHKEYPGQGVKWVELRAPKDAKKETRAALTDSDRDDIRAGAEEEAWTLKDDGDTREIEDIYNDVYARIEADFSPSYQYYSVKELEDALKYEGDTMQHCVGGYCPDVAEGRSRIYSLRDDKGQPQVTIEVKPHEGWFTKADRMPDPSGKNRSFHQLIDNERSELARQKGGFGYIGESYEDIANRLAKQYQLEAKPSISQIKGFKNKKPADEFLPFVQDFIKSDNWSDVGDLKNSGMIDTQKSAIPWPENTTGGQVDALLGGGINGTKTPKYKSSDFYKLAEQDLGSRYVTEQDYQGWLTKQLDLITPTEGMAHGGLVSTHFDPIKIQQIIAGLDDEYDPERIQQIVAQRESAYA